MPLPSLVYVKNDSDTTGRRTERQVGQAGMSTSPK
jgi:hypothetical protein